MRVLIIKLSSMGDLMHAMPALTDAANQFPDIEFDWVVDQAFFEVPLWHPNVKRVIKTAHRQWRKAPLNALNSGALSSMYRALNEQHYDVVVDLQSNIKSAVISWLHKGDVTGVDKAYCREYPAHWAYKHRVSVNLDQHSIEKLRELMAKALGYEKPSSLAEYGINFEQFPLPALDFELPNKYLLFVHNASWQTKLWPLHAWQELVEKAVSEGYSVLLPCGNDVEHQRAKQIAEVSEHAFALPRLSLNHMAALTLQAKAAVCCDTGLAHLTALAGVPAVTIYGPTDTRLIGTFGQNQTHVISSKSCAPCYKKSCPLPSSEKGDPVCMEQLSTEVVWGKLNALMTQQ
jgi:heptosyltransferase-1